MRASGQAAHHASHGEPHRRQGRKAPTRGPREWGAAGRGGWAQPSRPSSSPSTLDVLSKRKRAAVGGSGTKMCNRGQQPQKWAMAPRVQGPGGPPAAPPGQAWPASTPGPLPGWCLWCSGLRLCQGSHAMPGSKRRGLAIWGSTAELASSGQLLLSRGSKKRGRGWFEGFPAPPPTLDGRWAPGPAETHAEPPGLPGLPGPGSRAVGNDPSGTL